MSLAGKRVLPTRAAEDRGPLEKLLEARGASCLAMPCIAIVDEPFDDQRLRDADFVVVASAHAARRLRGVNARFAAVGKATADALGVDALLPREGVGADALLRTLAVLVHGKRVAVPRAEGGNPALVEGLVAAGAQVDAFTLYRTVTPGAADAAALRELREGRIDAIAFASGSAARGFVQLAKDPGRAKVVCMGKLCASEASAAGLRVDAIADGGFPELCDAIERAID